MYNAKIMEMKKRFFLFNILSTIFWLSFLSKTDSFFEVYALIAVLNIIFISKKKVVFEKHYSIISIVLTLCVAISNYNILDDISLPINNLDVVANTLKTTIFLVVILSGYSVFYGLIQGVDAYLNKLKFFT